MKWIYGFILFLSFSQNIDAQEWSVADCKSEFQCGALSNKVSAENVEQLSREFLKLHLHKTFSGEFTLKLDYQKASPYGYHIQFYECLKEQEIYGAFIKLNIALDGRILSMFSKLPEEGGSVVVKQPDTNLISPSRDTYKLVDMHPCFYYNGSTFIRAVNSKMLRRHPTDLIRIISDAQGQTLFVEQLSRYYAPQDTYVKARAKIFLPDPLT